MKNRLAFIFILLVFCFQSACEADTQDRSLQVDPTMGGENQSPMTENEVEEAGQSTSEELDLGEQDEGMPTDVDDSSVSQGCSMATTAVSRELRTVTVNGLDRSYRVTIPSSDIGTRLPIVIAFQGGDAGDYPFEQQQLWNELGDRSQFIFVSAIGERLPGNEGAWQLNTREGYTQDIEYVSAIIDQLSNRYCIDLQRVYATGYSLGAMFTNELACHLSERIAAIASFAGSMPTMPERCEPDYSMGIMHLHGQNDWLISYESRWSWKEWDSVGEMYDALGLVEFWQTTYRCQRRREETLTSGLHLIYEDCTGEARVEHHGLVGVDHDWPTRINEVETAEVIWQFLSSFIRTVP